MPSLNELAKKLNYQYQDLKLLEAALSHRSHRVDNNERMEFLGDSILNFIIADRLYHLYPHAKEGVLSRYRASLVQEETLAEMAQEFALGDFLILGPGELKSGGFRRKSILADALEAVICSIYLDAGFDCCRETVFKWFKSRLENIVETTAPKDPKTELQEYLQSKKMALPVYVVENISGKAHQQVFHVKCTLDKLGKTAVGEATSRRKAEQIAASELLQMIKKGK